LSEIWAIGLRNPWRYSFDRATGDLYIADVGQNVIEEVNFQAAESGGGENYGWRCREGSQGYNMTAECGDRVFVDPFVEYPHSEGRQSVTGGYVYRGCAIPEISGAYFYADFATGEVWSLRYDGLLIMDSTDHTSDLGTGGKLISSFGEDAVGELYVVEWSPEPNGKIYKIVPVGEPASCNVDCCDQRVGDVNGMGGDEPTIGDLSVMIDMLFVSGDSTLAPCLAEADIDQSGYLSPRSVDITIIDIMILMDYLYEAGPALGLANCL
jgi:hypothetical protein